MSSGEGGGGGDPEDLERDSSTREAALGSKGSGLKMASCSVMKREMSGLGMLRVGAMTMQTDCGC